jgi:Flp pilus assembly protein CpaB
VGERLAGPVRRGEPLTSGRLVGTDLTTGLPPGTVAVPVPLADDTVGQVVHPGDRIDLLAMPTAVGGIRSPGERSRATEVADHALVLAVLTAAAGEAATSDGVVDLVLALPRSTAARIAASESSERFAVVGDPP